MILLLGLAVDTWVGEWPTPVHPVVWIGRSVRWLERRAPMSGRAGPFWWGLGMAVGLPAGWAAVAGGSVALAGRLGALGGGWAETLLGGVVALYWWKASFALRLLGEAGRGVAEPLSVGDLDRARYGLRSLCSRDASTLDAGQLAAGTIESLAENLSDSFVAPLFWYVVAGVPGAVAYRVVNTLDAMIGYHGRYEWLGKASARLDDALNLVPARVTAGLLLVAGALAGGDVRRGVAVLVRDRGRTESPNAGWPMAAMAGLLGVTLEKPGHYALGAGLGVPGGADVARAWRICRVAAGMAALGAAGWLLGRGAGG